MIPFLLSLLVGPFAGLAAFAGNYSPEGVWPANQVSVCFASAGVYPVELRPLEGQSTHLTVRAFTWRPEQSQLARDAVERQYSAERTGIHFSGWLPCSEGPADVVLFVGLLNQRDGGPEGRASLGSTARLAAFPAARGFVFFRNFLDTEKSAVHEFGHLAGLMHEHQRLGITEDALCTTMYHAGFSRAVEQAGPVGTPHGPYDPHSVMNYCEMFRDHAQTRLDLSPGDLALLRFLYPTASQ